MDELKSGIVCVNPSEVISTSHGNRQTVHISLNDGTKEKIWFDAGKLPHAGLRKGDVVKIFYTMNGGRQTKRLLIDGNGVKRDIMNGSQPMLMGNPTHQQTVVKMPSAAVSKDKTKPQLSRETKEQMRDYIKQQAKIYSFCADTVVETMGDKIYLQNSEDIRAIATSLYITTIKQFSI